MQQIVDQVQAIPLGTKVVILAPVVSNRKGEFKKDLAELRKRGFVRVRMEVPNARGSASAAASCPPPANTTIEAISAINAARTNVLFFIQILLVFFPVNTGKNQTKDKN